MPLLPALFGFLKALVITVSNTLVFLVSNRLRAWLLVFLAWASGSALKRFIFGALVMLGLSGVSFVAIQPAVNYLIGKVNDSIAFFPPDLHLYLEVFGVTNGIAILLSGQASLIALKYSLGFVSRLRFSKVFNLSS